MLMSTQRQGGGILPSLRLVVCSLFFPAASVPPLPGRSVKVRNQRHFRAVLQGLLLPWLGKNSLPWVGGELKQQEWVKEEGRGDGSPRERERYQERMRVGASQTEKAQRRVAKQERRSEKEGLGIRLMVRKIYGIKISTVMTSDGHRCEAVTARELDRTLREEYGCVIKL